MTFIAGLHHLAPWFCCPRVFVWGLLGNFFISMLFAIIELVFLWKKLFTFWIVILFFALLLVLILQPFPFQKSFLSLFCFAGWSDQSRFYWCWCVPSESSQNLLHPTWWRWSWHGSNWCEETPGTISAITSCGMPYLQHKKYHFYTWHLLHPTWWSIFFYSTVKFLCLWENFLIHVKTE